jgi:diguanylate cyclase (GGDEF)-like protein
MQYVGGSSRSGLDLLQVSRQVTDDSQTRVEYLPESGFQPATTHLPRAPGHRRLSSDQRNALLQLPQSVPAASAPRDFLGQVVALVGHVLETKAAVAGKHNGVWVLAVESIDLPSLANLTNGGSTSFDRIAVALGLGVDLWRAEDQDWTLVGLAATPSTPVILLLEGDWTGSASELARLARDLSGTTRGGRAPWALDAATRRLTRTLADTSGLVAVGEAVLHFVVQAVPSRIASLAVTTGDGELSIVATLGYPHALVEHLRIASGAGVIGGVHQTRAPLVVADVSASPGLDRQRSRYRTNSFVAIPIIAGSETLGVVSLTDRIGSSLYTQEDVAAISVLVAPVALALGRERVLREAQAYAQAAVIDPVSGLFNRRYFQARLEEELHRAIRQLTSVGLLMVDLDGFKSINDRFGHVAGDMVIRDISEILRRSVRIFDVCTRFGGEEFAVMMPGGTAESAGTIAERIRQRVEAYQRSEPDLAGLHVTASIGVAVSPPGVTARDLIERADRALYHAKRAGKNRVSTARSDGSVVDA